MTGAAHNTDREIWREHKDDYYADSIFVTDQGSIGINCGGYVIVMPVRAWFQKAQESEWRTDMEGAKDGRHVLLAWGGKSLEGYWLDNSNKQFPWAGWKPVGMTAFAGHPTAWRPLPSPPSVHESTP
jgi:hypothetical protein